MTTLTKIKVERTEEFLEAFRAGKLLEAHQEGRDDSWTFINTAFSEEEVLSKIQFGEWGLFVFESDSESSAEESLLSTGQMLDAIQEGQVAESERGYVVRRNGNIHWGTDQNAIVSMNKFHLSLKWKLMPPVDEERVFALMEHYMEAWHMDKDAIFRDKVIHAGFKGQKYLIFDRISARQFAKILYGFEKANCFEGENETVSTKARELSTGKLLDLMQEGQIAESEKGRAVMREGSLYWEGDLKQAIPMNKLHLGLKWSILEEIDEAHIRSLMEAYMKSRNMCEDRLMKEKFFPFPFAEGSRGDASYAAFDRISIRQFAKILYGFKN